MTDHVWAIKVGTLPSVKAVIKKFSNKTHAKLGFFVEVEEVNDFEKERMYRAARDRESFSLLAKPLRTISHKVLGDLMVTDKELFIVTVYGPKLLNGKPVNAN